MDPHARRAFNCYQTGSMSSLYSASPPPDHPVSARIFVTIMLWRIMALITGVHQWRSVNGQVCSLLRCILWILLMTGVSRYTLTCLHQVHPYLSWPGTPLPVSTRYTLTCPDQVRPYLSWPGTPLPLLTRYTLTCPDQVHPYLSWSTPWTSPGSWGGPQLTSRPADLMANPSGP